MIWMLYHNTYGLVKYYVRVLRLSLKLSPTCLEFLISLISLYVALYFGLVQFTTCHARCAVSACVLLITVTKAASQTREGRHWISFQKLSILWMQKWEPEIVECLIQLLHGIPEQTRKITCLEKFFLDSWSRYLALSILSMNKTEHRMGPEKDKHLL